MNSQKGQAGLIALIIIGSIVAITVLWGLGVATGIISLAPHVISNKVQMNHDIIDKTVNADTCLQMQDWFRTQEGTITTLQTTVQNAQDAVDQFKQNYGEPKTYTADQQQQFSVLMQNLTGAKNEANDAINTYDAKSKQENLAYCKNGLPLFIHPF